MSKLTIKFNGEDQEVTAYDLFSNLKMARKSMIKKYFDTSDKITTSYKILKDIQEGNNLSKYDINFLEQYKDFTIVQEELKKRKSPLYKALND